jgi:AraC-like DNA-binding protein
LHELATRFGTETKNNTLHLPEDIGEGFLRSIELDGPDSMIFDYSLKQELTVRRDKDQNQYFILAFEELADPGKFALEIGESTLMDERIRNSAIYLTSFLFETEYTLFKGMVVRGLRVSFSKEWMKKYLHLSEMEDVLERYVSMKTENLWYKPVDAESRELLTQILQNPEDANLLFYQNKILRIVEIFFDWLRHESKGIHLQSISKNDIENAQKIEDILTSDDVVLPPTIKELARTAAMSESKLKKVFRTVYGLPIYEYFQKHRMQKARIMLLTRNYSIKDIGYSLGYSNLSNFTLAFKKEFGRLPSEIVRELK